MKINELTALLTPRLLLVPYSPHHVPTYHEWMKDEELRTATASEPLTLEEEHAMQTSWRTDHDKLTFIICWPPPPPPPPHSSSAASLEPDSVPSTREQISPDLDDAPSRMLGDINLFLYEDESEDEDDSDDEEGAAVERAETGNTPIIGELEVMIAEKSARGQGLALEALRAFMWYITRNLSRILAEYDGEEEENALRKLRYLRVKIGKDNVASIKLFGKLGFGVVGSREGNYFGEVEMRLGLKGVKEMIGREAGDVREMRYGE